ncbi:MAG: aminopeptidase P N-terminal domain-containing protein [Herminiimonas sp.]|nr:aminopeptidase P N-terminal domain-containing protein [Herminiimonas sp.]
MMPYATRRQSLIAQMQARGGGIAVIATAPEARRNNDVDHPYRHDSYFYYLTGFTEPEAVLVLIAGDGASASQSTLFCRDKNPEREIWDGLRHGPEAAREVFGFDAAFSIDMFDEELTRRIAGAPALFYPLGHDAPLEARIQACTASVRKQARSGVTAPASLHDVLPLLNEMRLFKDSTEIDIMRRAATISAGAHARAMRMSRPGMREYQIEAELLHEFRVHGADSPAYTSIVATGANACVLHYRAGDTIMQDQDIVLIDAGCEFGGYASDITRSYPASGKFSGPQKALYEIVLASQAAAIAAVGPGRRFTDAHDAAVKVLAQGMLDTGLLDQNKVGMLDDVLVKRDYRDFYMHSTGHWIGMDVHDVGDYHERAEPASEGKPMPSRILRPGMVVTVEPGIYVRPAAGVPDHFWNIGIRIEDDVLVTPEGTEVLSQAAPKTVAEIEAVMRH